MKALLVIILIMRGYSGEAEFVVREIPTMKACQAIAMDVAKIRGINFVKCYPVGRRR